MTAEQHKRISVIDPLGPAFERVSTILFRPFDLGKWLVIGFCAWLAYLGNGGGGGGGGGGNGRAQWNMNDARHAIEEAKEFFLYNLWIIPVGIMVLLFGIGLWIFLTWLSSRGRFMFLHCVAENKAEVKIPWVKFRERANSLFLFRIVVGFISLAVFIVPCVLVIFFILALISWPLFVLAIPGLIMASLAFLFLVIVFWLVHRFTMDFVLTIMFLRIPFIGTTAAWREFWTLLSANKAYFALYALFRIVIAIAIGAVIVLGFCIGCCCCCASVLLLIPYIGTVILLPVFVFERSYSLYYLRQFGPQFDVFDITAVETLR